MRERFAASGTNISRWARDRGFSESLVQNVLSGKSACRRGESHKIAVALGIKEPVTPPGEREQQSTPERLEGLRA